MCLAVNTWNSADIPTILTLMLRILERYGDKMTQIALRQQEDTSEPDLKDTHAKARRTLVAGSRPV